MGRMAAMLDSDLEENDRSEVTKGFAWLKARDVQPSSHT
jgi:hypothetical protein